MFSSSKYESTHMIIYILAIVALLTFYLFLANLVKLFQACGKCCWSISKALNLDDLEVNSNDYYSEISLPQLQKEHGNVRLELKQI